MKGGATARIAVATVSLVRNSAESTRLRHSLAMLADHGWPAFVCDGGSGDTFVEFLHSLPNVTVVSPVDRGLVGQVRASLSAAADAGDGLVLYTEADKVEFFDRHLRRFVASAAEVEDAGCVLASRSAGAFRSFPPAQQSAEGTINGLCSDFLRIEGDYSYGPFLLRPDLVPFVNQVPTDLGWGWRHSIFAIAHRLRRRLVHLVGDYECPEDQRVEDDRDRLHRLRQLGQNVNGLVVGLTVDLRRKD